MLVYYNHSNLKKDQYCWLVSKNCFDGIVVHLIEKQQHKLDQYLGEYFE